MPRKRWQHYRHWSRTTLEPALSLPKEPAPSLSREPAPSLSRGTRNWVDLPQEMNRPPLTGKVIPVRYEARSDTRNATA